MLSGKVKYGYSQVAANHGFNPVDQVVMNLNSVDVMKGFFVEVLFEKKISIRVEATIKPSV